MTTTILDFEPTRWYSISEAAPLLGITRQALLKQITRGKLPAKKVGRSYIIQGRHLKLLISLKSPKETEEEIHLRLYFDLVKRLHTRIADDPDSLRLWGKLRVQRKRMK